jgi:hypothetical protein
MTGSLPLKLKLALAWLLFVSLAMAVQAWTYSGLYRLLSEWQLSLSGEYDFTESAIMPTLILATPALIVLGQAVRAAPRSIQPASARTQQIGLRRLFVFGCIALAGAAASLLWALHLPLGSDPPLRIDIDQIGQSSPGLGSVVLAGTLDRAHAVSRLAGSGPHTHGRIFYIPVTGSTGRTQPTRFFVEVRTAGSGREVPETASEARQDNIWKLPDPDHESDQPAPDLPASQEEIRGVLVESGLPFDMVRMFEREHLAITRPYYVLLTDSDGARGFYYTLAGFALFVAALALLPAMAIAIGRRRA